MTKIASRTRRFRLPPCLPVRIPRNSQGRRHEGARSHRKAARGHRGRAVALRALCGEGRDTGKFRGVTVDLGTALAKKLGVPVEFLPHLASGEIQNSAASGKWDVTFMPVDDERKKFVDFGNAYHLLQSTYLVAPGSKLASVEEANAPGVRIGGVANTATFRAAQRTAPKATFVTVPGVDAAIAGMKAGEIDAIALSRESLSGLAAENSRLAHSRRRLPEFVDRGGGAEGQAGGARLCQPVHRGGQSLRPGAQEPSTP